MRVRHNDTGSAGEEEKPNGVRSLEIGQWLVVQNGNPREKASFALPRRFAGGVAILGSAKRAPERVLRLKPGEAVVLKATRSRR